MLPYVQYQLGARGRAGAHRSRHRSKIVSTTLAKVELGPPVGIHPFGKLRAGSNPLPEEEGISFSVR